MAPAAAVWAFFGGIHVLMSRFMPGAAVHDRRMPDWMHLTLGATELALLAAAVAAGGGLEAGLRSLERRKPGRWTRAAADAVRTVVASGFLFLFGASWTLFQRTGQFLDHLTINFVWTNRHTMIEYLDATHLGLAALLMAATVAASIAALRFGPRVLARVPDRRRASLSRIALGLALFCAAGTIAGESLHGSATGAVMDQFIRSSFPISKLYRQRRDFAAGPLLHATMTLVKSGGDRDTGLSTDAQMIRRPLVSLDQVLAGVDRTSLRRPNVVVVMIDSVRADQLRVGGAERDVMPNLDALAREGRVFVDTVSDSTHTNYSTPSPFSSTYPLRSKDTHIYPDTPAYPRVFLWDLLKAVGYRTAYVSSQDNRWGNMAAYLHTDGLETVLQPDRVTRDDAPTVDDAIKWVEGIGDGPFLLCLNLQNPHWPFKVPAGWPRRFGKPRDFGWVFIQFPRDRIQDVKNLYADALAYSDEQAGRLFQALKRRGVWDNTIVVAMSDHGEAFLEHGFAGHASRLYQEALRVPFVFRGPGVPPGEDRRPAQTLDLAPSILSLLGLPPHPGFQGLDLFGPTFPQPRSRFTVAQTSFAMQVAVERDGLKLISDQQIDLDILFDLRSDPGETVDLCQSLSGAARDLSWRLSVWRRAQLDYYGNPERCRKEYPPLIVEK